jgi:EpsI family protein
MARSVNLLLACVAMLAAAGLAYLMTPHRLMARTQEAFNIDAHIPHAFGEWSALPGIQAIKPPSDGLEAEIYNQEVSRAYLDKEGHGIMLMIAYGESQSDRLQLHHPEVCYTAQGFRVTKPTTTKFAWDPAGKPIPLTRMIATR